MKATENVTRGAAAPTSQKEEPSTDVRKLQEAVKDMDSMAQSALSEIATVARLVLHAMERPETYSDWDTIGNALSSIWSKAKDAENTINAIAGEVGCSHVDQRYWRRWAAASEAQKTGVATEVRHG